jgi:hypothetical protein
MGTNIGLIWVKEVGKRKRTKHRKKRKARKLAI